MSCSLRIPAQMSLPWLSAIVSALVGLFSPAPSRAQAQQPSASMRIVYTGGLFGYYRTKTPGSLDFPEPPASLLAELEKQQPQTLLLGMGDNFGPEFGASLQFVPQQGTDCPKDRIDPNGRYPEDWYKWDGRVAVNAVCDNVGAFLLKAGYQAIVPGREDFIYGSGWLRSVAQRLQRDSMRFGSSAIHRDNPLTMLAANLRIQKTGDPGGRGQRRERLSSPVLAAGELPRRIRLHECWAA